MPDEQLPPEASDSPSLPTTGAAASRPRATRNIVTRPDGKLVNVARQLGQLFVCVNGCCCGDEQFGAAPSRKELYFEEWTKRKLRNKVHLNESGCLGPCPLANVAMLLLEGHTTFFHSMNAESQVIALWDYIDAQVAANRYLPPPPELADFAFNAFSWQGGNTEGHLPGREAVLQAAVEQSGFLFLTQADTDLLALDRAIPLMAEDFPPVRAYTVNHLTSETDAIAFFDTVVPSAEVVVVRLHGGRASLPGFEHLQRLVEQNGQWLIAMPGTEDLDPDLTAASNAGVPVAHEVKAYLQYSGVDNYQQALYFMADHLLTAGYGYLPPIEQPRDGIYRAHTSDYSLEAWQRTADLARPTVGVLFYRSYLLTGNTDFIDVIVEEGDRLGLNVMPVFAYSLKDEAAARGELPAALSYFVDAEGTPTVDVVINTMSFAMGSAVEPGAGVALEADDWAVPALERLGVPQLQAITASTSNERWQASDAGLNPLDVAMNVAIPELDGRIITVPIAFKERAPRREGERRVIGGDVIYHAPDRERIARMLGIAQRLATLRRKPNAEKHIGVVLTNHNAKASRIANAVGLDSPASLLALLHRLADAGYEVRDIPATSDELMHMLVDHGHYDRDLLTTEQLRGAFARVSPEVYRAWFATLPSSRTAEVERQWDAAPGRYYVDDDGTLSLAGLEFGNVFVAVQPPRGYGMDKTAIMHRPDLAPPHPYLALYQWLARTPEEHGWGADALVHMGKHGSLEWLPGKGVGVSGDCYPDLLLQDLPMVYPFIVDDPGEGAAAKRRTHAVIVDHLPPPMTSADAYGPLLQVGRLVDEYYLLERTDPAKLPFLQQEIWQVIQDAKLDNDLSTLLNADGSMAGHIHLWDPSTHEDGVPYSISDLTASDFRHLVEAIHAYTHELTGAPIRDGLHTLGRIPVGEQLVEFVSMLTRLPNGAVPSLRDALARAFDLDIDALIENPGTPLANVPSALAAIATKPLNAHADALDTLQSLALDLLRILEVHDFAAGAINATLTSQFPSTLDTSEVAETLRFICARIVPGLRRVDDELTHILDALDGRYVPAGPSGAPTRGMAHVLPTGRNFYAVDPRVVPSPTAWQTGQILASGVIDRFLREEGRYPDSIGISIWGTSAMRTQGDDIAQVLALLGVRPRWQMESRRVIGLEVIPLAELGHPRIDVVCRISGFFRDAFPHAIALLDEAFDLVAALDEPDDQNAVRRNRRAEQARLAATGLTDDEAWRQAGFRIFGSPPGTYGAGILQLIDERNWHSDADFAETYVNWGGYAYTRAAYGVDARDRFRTALAGVQIALKNQDNREHDIFDSDDYLQFHGGMTATIRSITGANPKRYFGDSQDPARPRVRDLKEEALRVFRTRVVNPKWITSIQRHGYKGALEVAATVDYLFGYDATAEVIDDWMYEQVAQAYLLDGEIQRFFEQSNPWAETDIANRLLEAIQRGMWAQPDAALRAQIEERLLTIEDSLEGRARDTTVNADATALRDGAAER